MTLRVTPDGSAVVLDDKQVGHSPLGRELFLEPGAHTVYATHNGRRSEARSFQVSPGSRLSFTLAVSVPVEAPTKAAAPERLETASQHAQPPLAAQPPSRTSVRAPVLIAGGASALLAAGLGTYFAARGGQARDAENAARSAVNVARDPAVPLSSACSGSTLPDAFSALASSVDVRLRFNNLAAGAFIGAGVLAAATTTAFVLWKEPRPENSGSVSDRTSRSAFSMVPVVGALNGVGVSGRF